MRYSIPGASMGKMKAYSIDLREKIVQAYEKGDTPVRKVASRFGVAKLVNPKHLKNLFTNCCYCTS